MGQIDRRSSGGRGVLLRRGPQLGIRSAQGFLGVAAEFRIAQLEHGFQKLSSQGGVGLLRFVHRVDQWQKLGSFEALDRAAQHGLHPGRRGDEFPGDRGQRRGSRARVARGVSSVAAFHGVEDRRLRPEGQGRQGGRAHVLGRLVLRRIPSQPLGIGRPAHAEVGVDGAADQRLALKILPVQRFGEGGQGFGNRKVVVNGAGRFGDDEQVPVLEK